jgi:hypothetical protein
VTVIEHEAFEAVVTVTAASEPGVAEEVTDLICVAATPTGRGATVGAAVGAAFGTAVGAAVGAVVGAAVVDDVAVGAAVDALSVGATVTTGCAPTVGAGLGEAAPAAIAMIAESATPAIHHHFLAILRRGLRGGADD